MFSVLRIEQVPISKITVVSLVNSLWALDSVDKGCCYQLIFSSSLENPTISIHVVIENSNEHVLLQSERSLENLLKTNGYVVGLLTNNSVSQLASGVMQNPLFALCKSEIAVTSPYSYCGFYYYSDRIQPEEDKNQFTALFDILLQNQDSAILIQLVPTQLYEDEHIALMELSGAMEIMCGQGMPSYGGQVLREPYAQEASEIYRYYHAMSGQPMFLFSISISSPNLSGINALASVVREALMTEEGKVPRLEVMPVPRQAISTATFGQLPIVVQDYLHQHCRNPAIWQGCDNPPSALSRMPFLLTLKEAGALFKLPFDDGRTAGIISKVTPMDYFTINAKHLSSDNVQFGTRVGYRQVLGCPFEQFTQHMLIVGKPGTGKTTFALHMLLQFHKEEIPFLAIEPTKTEYRALIDKIPDLQIFTPGNSSVSMFSINPFIPPDGITVEQYRPTLASAFKAAFDMPSPLDSLFENTISRTYTAYGWRSYSKATDSDVHPFGLYEFICEFKKMLAQTGYGKEVMGNLQSGGTLRLMNLIEQNPILYDTISTIPLGDLLKKPTIIELNAIENQQQKALLMALLLIQVCAYTKHERNSNGQLRNILLIDEAHVLLDAQSGNSPGEKQGESMTSLALQNMVAEIRSYGTGIIIADQSALRVGSGIRANTDIKVAFQLVARSEKEAIADCTNMSEAQRDALGALEKGQAYVFFLGLNSPQVVITPDIRKQLNIRLAVSDDEIRSKTVYSRLHKNDMKPYSLCQCCSDCSDGCDLRSRENASFAAQQLYEQLMEKLTTKEKLYGLLEKYDEMMSTTDDRRTYRCTEIQLARIAILNKGFQVRCEQLLPLFSDLWKEATL